MNKKQLAGTLLGTIIGGLGLGFLYLTLVNRQELEKDLWKKNHFDYDVDDYIKSMVLKLTFIGSFFGLMIGGAISTLLPIGYQYEESHPEADNPYREFFESQQIETNPNQSVNESTPLLQEYVVNINNEENLPIINTSSIHNYNSL